MIRKFRNLNKIRMIRPALAERITLYLKRLRKDFIGITPVLLLLLYESHMQIFRHIVFLPLLFLPLLGIVTLDSFFGEAGKEDNGKKKIDSFPTSKDYCKDVNLKDTAIKILLPELDEVEHLDNGKGLRVAAYLRVSTQRQAKKGVSLMAQKEELRNLARKIGASTIYWFIDAKSAVSFIERKLNAIYRLAELGVIDKVVCREIDRIGRESFTLLAFIITVRTLGITTVVPSGELDVKRWQDLIIASIKTVMAEEENTKRTKSALSSKIYKFMQKKWNMPVPLGYRKNKEGWISKMPEYEPVIKEMFQLFIALKDYSKVANHINARFLRLIGKKLSGEVVSRLLTNPVYVGRPRYGRERTQEILGDTAVLEVEDPSLAFVDNETFERVQRIIAKKKEKYQRKRKPLDELSEILKEGAFDIFENLAFICSVCQTPMRKNGQSYICPNCGRRRRLIKKSELEKLAEWIIKREKALKVFQQILKKTNYVDDIIEKLRKHGINQILCELSDLNA